MVIGFEHVITKMRFPHLSPLSVQVPLRLTARVARVRAYLNDGHCVGRSRDNYISLGQEPIFMRIEKDQRSPGVIGRLKITADGIYWFPKGEQLHSMNRKNLLTWERLSQTVKS